ncbi:MAG: TraR/DksA family transcriptional regulator [Bryobacteraceae bacterium]
MTLAETAGCRKALEAKQTEIAGSLHNRDEIAIERAPDALDEVQQMGEREIAVRNLDRDSGMLRLIRRALARIGHGSYGVCLHCEEDIPVKRLRAVPWAAYCIECQERADRQEISEGSLAGLAAVERQ